MPITKLRFRQLRLNTTDFFEEASTGEIQLRNDAVTTAKIRAQAVTESKIANLNVTTGKIADEAITTAKLADSAVSTAKIAASAIETAKINDQAITTAKIADGAVTSDKLAVDSVTTAKILDLNVTEGKLAANSVVNSKILNANVTTAKIGNQQITNAKIADDSIEISKFADISARHVFMADGAGDVITSLIGNVNLAPGDYDSITGLGPQAQDLNMNSNKIVNLADPQNDHDGANKRYVDGVSDSLYWKAPAVARSTANIANLSAVGGTGAFALDTVTVANGDRVLLMDQTDASENGIYVYDDSGAGSLSRPSDADSSGELNGAAIFVMGGSLAVGRDKGYVQTEALSALSDDQTWVQFSGLGQYSAGSGISISNAGVISISTLVSSQIDSRRDLIKDGLTAAEVDASADAINGADGFTFGSGGSSYDAGMVAVSAQVYLNGTLLRAADAKANIIGYGGTDSGDYFIDSDSGDARIKVSAGLIAQGDRLEVRYFGA